ncbi:hypothetical protein ACFWGI_37600 [Streptomyces niveus]|uniref:hypothetical protein n=1 Tax=Streptomyces niveus TaxID=193462 RepID=UPI00365F12AA
MILTHPHRAYIEAVAAAAANHRRPASELNIWPETEGLLSAVLRYGPAHQGGAASAFTWPRGLNLLWDQRQGWHYTGAQSRAPHQTLPLPELASPRDVAGMLAVVLAGGARDLPAKPDPSAGLWDEADHYAARLGRLDVADALAKNHWTRVGNVKAPMRMRSPSGRVVWSMTADVDPVWPGDHWLTSYLRALDVVKRFDADSDTVAIIKACCSAEQSATNERTKTRPG